MTMDQDPAYRRARARAAQLRAFYTAVVAYVAVNLLLFVINVITSPGNWWFYWVTIFWGLGMVVYGLNVFGLSQFGQDWEDRKTQELLEKERRQGG
jgi:hypothetical protein